LAEIASAQLLNQGACNRCVCRSGCTSLLTSFDLWGAPCRLYETWLVCELAELGSLDSAASKGLFMARGQPAQLNLVSRILWLC